MKWTREHFKTLHRRQINLTTCLRACGLKEMYTKSVFDYESFSHTLDERITLLKVGKVI